MDFAEGGTLQTFLDTTLIEGHKKFQFLKYIGDILDIVRQMHDKNIVHRDIKPENILFSGGKLLLADFGFAK
jgi:serine/threonine protein kinase